MLLKVHDRVQLTQDAVRASRSVPEGWGNFILNTEDVYTVSQIKADPGEWAKQLVRLSGTGKLWFSTEWLTPIAWGIDTAFDKIEEGAVEHPAHYQHPSGIEVIDIIKSETFLRGNIVKYLLRAPYKGNELEDLLKAKQYLDWEIDRAKNA